MGPTCEVLLERDDESTLAAIDATLATAAEEVRRTREGRTWDVWVGGRPIHVHVVKVPPAVELAAGCNHVEDYAVLRSLAEEIADVVGGLGTGPKK